MSKTKPMNEIDRILAEAWQLAGHPTTYCNRLEAMLRLAVSQRDGWRDQGAGFSDKDRIDDENAALEKLARGES